MTRQCGIYVFKNVHNGKHYVGQSIDILSRRKDHLYLLKKGVHPNGYFQASFNKYGANAFEFRVVELVDVGILDVRENFWIIHYRSNDREFGYNLDRGGNSNRVHSEETRAKIGAGNKGKVISQAQRDALRKSRLGSKLSVETRAKMSASGKGRKFTEEHKRKIALSRLGRKFPRRVE